MNQAIQMLIARMQTHPEDFFGGLEPLNRSKLLRTQREINPKFRHLAVQIERHIIGAKDRDESSADALWHLTAEERSALRVAYTEARRVRFDAEVIHTLLAEPEPEPGPLVYNEAMRLSLDGNLGIGVQASSQWYGNAGGSK